MASREEQKRKLREEREAAQRADASAAERRKRTAYLAGGIGLIALIVVVALVLVSQAGDDSGDTVQAENLFAGIPQKGVTLGDPDAPVTVVEYGDLQCEFCRAFAIDDLPGILKDYVKPGDVKMELRLVAFLGPDSETGRGVAAGAAEQSLIWPFAENVYNNQQGENTGYMNTEFLTEQLSAVKGMDVQAALAVPGTEAAQQYAAESDRLAQEAGVNGTPTFTVTPDGGETKNVSAAELPGAIDDALAETDSSSG